MIETLPQPISLSAVTVNVDDAQQVRLVTHRVAELMSEEACAALREFLANVREHCAAKEVNIVELPSVLIAYDHGGGILDSQTHKPDGEGGYGLSIMRALGAEVRRWEEGTMFIMAV